MIVDPTNSQIKKEQNKDDNINRAPNRRKRGYDSNAPKFPLTGYFRFVNEYKDKYRQQNPKLPLHEVTKLLAADWIKLPPITKKRYLDEAETDKERYTKEMEEYQKTESFKYLFNGNINATKLYKKECLPVPVNSTNENSVKKNGEVAIFTQEFLQHNKARESELRQLRRQQGEVEDENALLTERVHKLKEELQTEQTEVLLQRQNSTLMMQHLNLLKLTIASNLKGVTFPAGCNDTVNPNNVESFLRLVCDMAKEAEDSNNKNINSIDNEVVKNDKSTGVSYKIDDSKKENQEDEKVDFDEKKEETEHERLNDENDLKKKSKKEFVNKVKCIIGNMKFDSK